MNVHNNFMHPTRKNIGLNSFSLFYVHHLCRRAGDDGVMAVGKGEILDA